MLLTIFVSAILLTVGIGFNWIVKEHINGARALKNKTEAMLKITSTFDTLIFYLLSGKRTNDSFILSAGSDLGVVEISLDNSMSKIKDGMTLILQDANGKLSLTSLNSDALKRLIKNLDPGRDASTITDSLEDWIDNDSFRKFKGAEEFYYKTRNVPYSPRNYPVQYLSEFSLIKGMDKELFKKLEPYITILPSGGFNPNTASDEVIMAYLDIDENSLRALHEYRANAPIVTDRTLHFLTGRKIEKLEGTFFFPYVNYDLILSYGTEDSMYTIKAGISLSQTINYPYTVVYWKEG